MKTSEERWQQMRQMMDYYGYGWERLDETEHAGFGKFLAAIRADALAEKPKEPDADEERAKREYERFRAGSRELKEWGELQKLTKEHWKKFVSTLPERHKRSTGQVMTDELWKRGVVCRGWRELDTAEQSIRDGAATALGIQPQE